jgi:uncharacterized protein (DUF1778 family)
MNKHKHQDKQPDQLSRERVLTFRVTFDQLDTLKRAAKQSSTTVSTVIREALSKVDAE